MEQKSVGRSLGMFPNFLDFLVMAVWVSLAQILAVCLCRLCGLEFPDIALVNSADDQISLSTQLAAAQSLAVMYPISMGLSIAGVLIYRRLRGQRLKFKAWSKVGFDPSLLLSAFVLMVAIQVAIEPLTELMPEAPGMVGRGFFTVLVSVVFAPSFEEILCRGILLESYRSKSGVWAALICSSLFFGIIHGHITAAFSATILGLVLGYAYIRTNSIFSVIILHAMNNGLALALMAFGLGESSFRDIFSSTELYWAVWAASLLVTIMGFAIMFRKLVLIRRKEKLPLQE